MQTEIKTEYDAGLATPEEAAAVANARDASFVNQASGGLDNMAEGGGYA